MSKEYWNNMYNSLSNRNHLEDNWLEKYNKIISESKSVPIIDLGCGLGHDTLYLLDNKYKVISCDFSEVALEKLKELNSSVNVRKFDIKEGLPFKNQTAKIIISSLSLHYFSECDTKLILQDIQRVLVDQGVLLCRVNSINDINHGAGKGIMIENNFYNINGNYKRFFDEYHLRDLFKDWNIMNIEETQINRYKASKVAWEIAVRKK